VSHALSQAVAEHDLSQHPFYRAWSEGSLPIQTLALYAAEYGEFIGTVPTGWRAMGETGIAATEEEHARLWAEFASSLGEPVRTPTVPAVAELCATLDRMAGSPECALGALYAFEAQQPQVARSKLDGLKRHYRCSRPGLAVDYFKAHLEDYAEPALLESRFDALEPADQDRARAAAATMGTALWAALDGIMSESTGETAPPAARPARNSAITSQTRSSSSSVTQ